MKPIVETCVWIIGIAIVAIAILDEVNIDENCTYIDPCTYEERIVPCEWIIDMPDSCYDSQGLTVVPGALIRLERAGGFGSDAIYSSRLYIWNRIQGLKGE